jgi:D-threo-aldose 1-dehydrogenase
VRHRARYGAAPLGNLYRAVSDAEADAAVQAAWDVGVRYFDTAPHYGLERDLAAGFDVPADLRRQWDFSRDGVLRSIDDSLARLGVAGRRAPGGTLQRARPVGPR